ncbi:CopG family transcriptional regulator [Halegenticoccus soli]|uniref:CopG family transcriptional regulator n=1 Tax=Halegenticoccus soli TaxID=1985678 RepID=UPI000C6D6009|nr:CopG family transcriptional regulator [Halegenticoccus soli]
MAGEQSEALPAELREWLDAKAAELGVGRNELLTRAVVAFRLIEEGSDALARSEREREAIRADVDALSARVEAVESDLDGKVADLRERLVRVKRETDGKAPEGHEHPALREQVGRAAETAAEARERADALDDRLDRGFENYEEVLEGLRDESDELDEKAGRLARAVVDLQSRAAALEAEASRRRATAALREAANGCGVDAAKCGACGETVHVGLLSEPRCPHCERGFADVEPPRGFFGSAALTVGDPPALDGRCGTDADPDRSSRERSDRGRGAPRGVADDDE